MRRRKSVADLPSLFDEPATDLPASTWQEVPAARFDAWSNAEQLRYCRDRDLDAALTTPNEEDALWHQQRAKMYQEMLTNA